MSAGIRQGELLFGLDFEVTDIEPGLDHVAELLRLNLNWVRESVSRHELCGDLCPRQRPYVGIKKKLYPSQQCLRLARPEFRTVR